MMFIAIYEFVVKPGHEAAFIKNWEIVTEAIFLHCGSFGSRLHLETDRKYVAYAQWPSEADFDSEKSLPAEAINAMELMKSCCLSTKLIHRLTVVADRLKSS